MATGWIKTCWPRIMVHRTVAITVLSAITCNGVSIDWWMGPFTKCPCNYIVHVNQTQSSFYLMNIVWLPICYELGSTNSSSMCCSLHYSLHTILKKCWKDLTKCITVNIRFFSHHILKLLEMVMTEHTYLREIRRSLKLDIKVAMLVTCAGRPP